MFSRGIVGTYELFKERWRDPVVRKNVAYLFLGKLIGLGIVVLLISKW